MGEIEIQMMHLRGKVTKNTERLQEILFLMKATVQDFQFKYKEMSAKIKSLEDDAKRQNAMVEELKKFVEHLQEKPCKNEK